MEQILKMVCAYYKLTPEEIRSKSRERYLVRARQMFYLLMFENMHQIAVSKASEFLGQDHATAIHGIKKMNEEISLYPEYRKDYTYFNYRLSGNFTPKEKYYGGNKLIYCNPCSLIINKSNHEFRNNQTVHQSF